MIRHEALCKKVVLSCLLAVCLGVSDTSHAASKGKLIGFMAEYQETKEKYEKLKQADRTVLGYAADYKPRIAVLEQAGGLSKEVLSYYFARQQEAGRSKQEADIQNARTAYVLYTATKALQEAVSIQLADRQGQPWPFIDTVTAKYEDIMASAEQEVHKLVGQP